MRPQHLVLVTCLFAPACKTSLPPQDTPPATVAPEPPPPVVDSTPAPIPAPEVWVGRVELLGGRLDFAARLEADPHKPGAWRGRMDIPAQGVKDFPLSDIRLAPDAVEFTLAPPGAPEAQHAIFIAERTASAPEAAGLLTQNGQTYKLTLRRLPPGESPQFTPRRPQEPKPPFPYLTRELTYTSEADKVTVACTFTAPAATSEPPPKFPGVVLLTGSGAQDRDEAIMGHKPFAVLADHLTRAGVATLRCDDRGVGGTGGKLASTPHKTQAQDARGALTLLTAQPEVDAAHAGLLGHSEGANIAMLAAAADRRVAFVVLLAGMGVTGREILPMQMAALFRAQGASEDKLTAMVAAEDKLLDALMARKKPARAELEKLTSELASQQIAATRDSPPPSPELLAQIIKQTLDAFDTVAMHDLLRHDPRAPLKKLKKPPVLALNGGLDLQVPPAENLGRIEQALKAAGNKDVTLKTLPGLNHLFQHAKTGGIEEYSDIEETIAPEVLSEVSSWILARTRPAAPPTK
ncbi:MAG: alpha/beta fold hydrolase [Myxococcales bacterium]|nr:alpha/beta fold hydrolase [Myxococcales bacterium]